MRISTLSETCSAVVLQSKPFKKLGRRADLKEDEDGRLGSNV